MTTAPAIYWEVAAKPKGTPPEVGQLYRIIRRNSLSFTGEHPPFRGRVVAINGDTAEIEITSGIATSYFAEDCRLPGQRVTVEACHCFFLPE